MNYTEHRFYLARLSERLDNLGYNLRDVIPPTLMYNEGAIMGIIREKLNLPYCVRCKLPCDPEDMLSPHSNTCNEHE